MLRIKHVSRDPTPAYPSAGEQFGELEIISVNKRFRLLIKNQATPGFELGKKDLQSSALPLGHAAKTIQNR
jgi:hypothetical protein